MSEKTLTRMDLSEAVFREVGLSRNESAQLVESVLGHMSDALASGESSHAEGSGTTASGLAVGSTSTARHVANSPLKATDES